MFMEIFLSFLFMFIFHLFMVKNLNLRLGSKIIRFFNVRGGVIRLLGVFGIKIMGARFVSFRFRELSAFLMSRNL